MFRYILAILLVNTCYHSLGNPVPKRISSALIVLESHCKNPFLNNLIKSKITECSTTVQLSEQYQCLIFYDMSNKLCSALSTSQLVLNEDYITKINEVQDVNSLCETAVNWQFGNLSELAAYKPALERVFKHQVSCGKVCEVEELTSNDANFYCKFFNWGLRVLKTSPASPANSATSQKSANETFTAPDTAAEQPETKKEVQDQHNEPMDISIKNPDKTKVTEPSSVSVPEKVSDPSDIISKPNTGSTTNMVVSSSVIAPNTENDADKIVVKEVVNSPSVKVDKIENSGLDQNGPAKVENEVGNIPVDAKVEELNANGALEHKDPVLDNPKKTS